MELGTFGAILKFALDTETKVMDFYKSASTKLRSQQLIKLFNELTIRGEKRIKTLERVRRENTTEMILEPIVSFDSDEHSIQTRIPEPTDDKILREIAIAIESKVERFYNTAARKINFLSEAAYAFELLAEKNTDAKKILSS